MKLEEVTGTINLDKVRKVLESDIPGNQLEIITGIPRMTISRYRKKGYDVSNIKLKHLLTIMNEVKL